MRGFVVFLALLMTLVGCSDVTFRELPLYSKEEFVQTGTPKKLDILIVVDNSRSMRKPQEKMAEKMASFTKQLSKVDWQLAVTTTDVSNGPYGLKGEFLPFDTKGTTILTPDTPFHSKKFLKAIVRPESIEHCSGSGCPSDDERALEAISMAIQKRNKENKGFFRENVDFISIALTDEDEGSDGRSKNLITPLMLLDEFHDTFPEKNFQFHGIILIPGDKKCKRKQGPFGKYSTFAYELAEATEGLSKSVCSNNFAKELEDIGKKPRDLTNIFLLEREPYPPSLEVTVTPRMKDHSYTLEQRKIIFKNKPPLNSRITVTYIAVEDLPEEPEEPEEKL